MKETYYSKNKEHLKSIGKKYYQNNKKKILLKQKEYKRGNEKVKSSRLEKKYGITIDDYNLLYKNQIGKCSICGAEYSNESKKLVVDHDHKTLIIRGLLCKQCNIGLGYFKDNIVFLENGIKYLKSHQ